MVFSSASLYVADLSPNVTEAELYEVFNAAANVASIRVCRDSRTRISLKYAYVNFHSVREAEHVLDTLNYAEIHGQSCRLMWAIRDPTMRHNPVSNLFVRNL
ncbi:MAG: hypothetical protein KVP17_005171, partial [Porospora cf. gigantea B]|uniref:uncharacterized protein n=1 Tax=Porospora cf. gigantea A TaxID=2853593 RepID=UPI00355AA770